MNRQIDTENDLQPPLEPKRVPEGVDYAPLLEVAIAEARVSLGEGGIPIGAALFSREGRLLGKGHNRQVQEADLSLHAEVDAFRRAGVQTGYRDKILVTTLAPCWFCSGLVRHFQIGTLVIGEAENFPGAGVASLQEDGIRVVDLSSSECAQLLSTYIQARPEVWGQGGLRDDGGE